MDKKRMRVDIALAAIMVLLLVFSGVGFSENTNTEKKDDSNVLISSESSDNSAGPAVAGSVNSAVAGLGVGSADSAAPVVVDSNVEKSLDSTNEADVIVIFKKDKKQEKQAEEIKDISDSTVPKEEKKLRVKEILQEKKDSIRLRQQKAIDSIGKKKKARLREIKKYNFVNGFSAKINKESLEELKKNPDVKGVFYNRILQITDENEPQIELATSTETIGAVNVWNNLGYTGKNITVAVVDTGIDYTHDALGNCTATGINCRVRDGYDFYNYDADPIDDHSHGTHVAGIIGANTSTFKGVAPDADFYAIKVCNSGGSCPSDRIIQGIDWAIGRQADVISISIGGHSYPNYGYAAESIAADDAADAGIVVAIAAGNEGESTGVISSPGDAKKIITVGALDDKSTNSTDDDTIASYSNFGPSAFGRLDPELIAPGTGIYSTVLNEGYSSKSGTSMATPHVSGAAALLLEYNSSLSAFEIRERLMHSANNLPSNLHVFAKGAGSINVTRAIMSNVSVFVNGDDRQEASIVPGAFEEADFRVKNKNTHPIDIDFSADDLTDLEATSYISSSQFNLPLTQTLAAGEEKNIKIRLTVPYDSNATIYGTTFVLNDSDGNIIRIPAAITVPLLGEGVIYGLVDDDNNGCASSSCGDWIYYKIKNANSSSITAALSWTGSSNDLDLFIYSPNGERVDYSDASSGESETVSINSVYDEYWLAVRSYTLASSLLKYNITVSYAGNLSVTPQFSQITAKPGELRNITFIVKNDGIAKTGINFSARVLGQGEIAVVSGNLSSTAGSYVWNSSSSGLDLNTAKYLSARLDWNDYMYDLDFDVMYNNGSWQATDYQTSHYNPLSQKAYEEMNYIDVQHYLWNNYNLGMRLRNSNSTIEYNLTLNFSNYIASSKATVSPGTADLSANQELNVTANINVSGIPENQSYEMFFVAMQGNTTYAFVPVKILITANRPLAWDSYALNQTAAEDSSIIFYVNTTDPDNDTAYYSVNDSGFIINNLTGMINYTPPADFNGVKGFNIAATDRAYNITSLFFVNITPVNDAPVIYNVIGNANINEGNIVNLTINATDIDGDALNYSANDTRFTQAGNSFWWQTGYADSGSLTVRLNATDGNLSAYTDAVVIIAEIEDNDNDGVNNSEDFIYGTNNSINAGFSLKVYVNNSLNISRIISGTSLVNITNDTSSFVEFNWTFNSSNILNLSNITIQKQATTAKGSLLAKGIIFSWQGWTKTIYIDNLIPTQTTVCAEDKEISTINEVSTGCNGADETLIYCTGAIQSGYSCTDLGDSYQITGLRNSGVKEQCADSDGDNYGAGCALGADCNDNNANVNPGKTEVCDNSIDDDCDGTADEGCSSGDSGGGSGGGGGGSGGGGGGSGGAKTYILDLKDSDTVQTLGVNNRIKFKYSNGYYYMKLLSLGSNYAKVNVTLMPETTINLGEIIKFDLDNDGYDDFYVNLEDVKSSNATFAFRMIKEKREIIEKIAEAVGQPQISVLNPEQPAQMPENANEEVKLTGYTTTNMTNATGYSLIMASFEKNIPYAVIFLIILTIGFFIYNRKHNFIPPSSLPPSKKQDIIKRIKEKIAGKTEARQNNNKDDHKQDKKDSEKGADKKDAWNDDSIFARAGDFVLFNKK